MKKTILDQLLDENVVFKNKEKEDKILLNLLKEINLIKNASIKSFVRSVLLKAEDFWKIPSSFSEEKNPIDEHGIGGNIIHTKRVIRIAEHICDSYMVNQEDRDMVYAACLIHDVTKAKIDNNGGYIYDEFHVYTVDSFVDSCVEKDKKYASEGDSSTLYLKNSITDLILRLVRCHRGPWSPVPETYPTSNAEMIVHLSDHIACNLHGIIDGETVIKERWKFDNGVDKDDNP
jgi:HD superfamily phosphohydrolase YqeK